MNPAPHSRLIQKHTFCRGLSLRINAIALKDVEFGIVFSFVERDPHHADLNSLTIKVEPTCASIVENCRLMLDAFPALLEGQKTGRRGFGEQEWWMASGDAWPFAVRE